MATFLVAGSPEARKPLTAAPQGDDQVIAIDYGARHARAWGWPIHLLIGDLDSLPQAEAAALQAAGVPILRAPAAKDETDLELALAHALAGGGARPLAQRIAICAALGGRADHMVANVLLLARPELRGLDVAILEGAQTIRLLAGPQELELAGGAGDLLSLLPLGGDAEGVVTAGLAYPLRGETLFAGQARGVSNVFEGPVARVALRSGLLLVMHTRG